MAPSSAIDAGEYLHELSVQIVSPAANGTVRSAASIRTSCARRLTRCISTREALRVPERAVLERVEVEIAVELTVDAHEQVLVERGGDTEGIVVGEQQLALRLDEVGAEQERVARPQPAAHAAQEHRRLGGVEVADVGAEEEHERRAARRSCRRRVPQPAIVRRSVLGHRDVRQSRQCAGGKLERGRRDVDQVDARRRAAATDPLDERRDLHAVAATELDDRREVRDRLDHGLDET